MALCGEAACVSHNHPTYLARLTHALELLASITQRLNIWHVCRMRAQQMIDELRSELPLELAEAAIARGQQFDWQVSIAALLDELARSGTPALLGAAEDLAQRSASVAA
jgi:hypothetical protein